MKVLWICNIMLPMVAEYLKLPASNKEGWLTGLADTILRNRADNHIELAVAFPVQEAPDKIRLEVPVRESQGILTCYPFVEDTNHPESYSQELEVQLKAIVEDWEPDVVHCFGTEFPHTLAITKVCPGQKVLLGIQGLCKLYAERYLADLPERVVNRVTFRDFLKKDSIREQHEKFIQRGKQEVEAVCNAGHVTGRTWIDKKFTAETNPKVEYHFMNETLRSNFYEGSWQADMCEKHSIFLSQGNYPIKGLHYMLKAMPKILEQYPDAKVYVAGDSIANYKTLKEKIKISSYGKYILELLQEYSLQDKVVFLGKMNAEEMKAQFMKSGLFVCPSVIENSPNSLGEAMLLGVPCVTALVGGIASIFEDGVDGIAYPGYGAECYAKEPDRESAQAKVLAEAVLRMWADEEKMTEYTRNASEHARRTHNGQENYKRLVEIYEEIITQEA
ncbi:MAG: glycosyltransferase family 4 protein [Lachnospiraceae bacterium]|nr:glycosyltransferase family 4 protein [Lachnospiraceae bacterium]MBQ7777037.1 glycosyltransferase family 4 protein [Lachnospiraceae bacterium]